MWASVYHVEEIDHFQATSVGIMLNGTLIAVMLMSVGVGKTVIKKTPQRHTSSLSHIAIVLLNYGFLS